MGGPSELAIEVRTALQPNEEGPPAEFGGHRQTTDLDLALGAVIALGLPFTCRALFFALRRKAWLSLFVVYYLLCCVLVPRWRKGSFDYSWSNPLKDPKIVAAYLFGLCMAIGTTAKNYYTLPRLHEDGRLVALTVLLWVPLNSALEQACWLYCRDSWRNRWRTEGSRKACAGAAVGWMLFFVVSALQHTQFWGVFLPVAEDGSALVKVGTVLLNIGISLAYTLIYDAHRSMWLLWSLHVIVDAQLVLIPQFSIWSRLF